MNPAESRSDPSILFQQIGLEPELTGWTLREDGLSEENPFEEEYGFMETWSLTNFPGAVKAVELSVEHSPWGYHWNMGIECNGPDPSESPTSVFSNRARKLCKFWQFDTVDWDTDPDLQLTPETELTTRLKSRLTADNQVKTLMFGSKFEVQIRWYQGTWKILPKKEVMKTYNPYFSASTAGYEHLNVFVSSRHQWELYERLANVIARLDETDFD